MENKKYDLEERSFQFAKNVALFCKNLERTISNIEYVKQVIRSSSSVGANYIEANESLSKKDFIYRIKISRKEAKETKMWLRLIKETNSHALNENEVLLQEAEELKKILSAIIVKNSQ
jgi:four helix bundle protein